MQIHMALRQRGWSRRIRDLSHVSVSKAPFTRYNLLSIRLSNRLSERFDNHFDSRLDVCLHDTVGCQTRCTTGLTTGCIV